MIAQPLCPLVLGMLARGGRSAGAVAREIDHRGLSKAIPPHRATAITVARLRREGLIYSTRAGQLRISGRGRRELMFQRGVWRAAMRESRR